MPLTHEDRVRHGRFGALKRLAQESDWSAVTEAARAAGPNSPDWHLKRLIKDGVLDEQQLAALPPEQRQKMGEAARRAWYLQLGEPSRRARAARKAVQEQA